MNHYELNGEIEIEPDFYNLTNYLSEELMQKNPKTNICDKLQIYLSLKSINQEKTKWRSYLLLMYSDQILQLISQANKNQKKKINQSMRNIFPSSSGEYEEEKKQIEYIYKDFLKNPINFNPNIDNVYQSNDSIFSNNNYDANVSNFNFSHVKMSTIQKIDDQKNIRELQNSNPVNSKEFKERQIHNSMMNNDIPDIRNKLNNSISETALISELKPEQKELLNDTSTLENNKEFQEILKKFKSSKNENKNTKNVNMDNSKSNLNLSIQLNDSINKEKSFYSDMSNSKIINDNNNNNNKKWKDNTLKLNLQAPEYIPKKNINEDNANSIIHSKGKRRENKDSDIISLNQSFQSSDNSDLNFNIKLTNKSKEIENNTYSSNENKTKEKIRKIESNRDINCNDIEFINIPKRKDKENLKVIKHENKINSLISNINNYKNVFNFITNKGFNATLRVEISFQGMNKENTNKPTKLKILTIICLLFNFFTKNQKVTKENLIKNLFEGDNIDYFKKYFFNINKEKDIFLYFTQLVEKKEYSLFILSKESFLSITNIPGLIDNYKLLVFYHIFTLTGTKFDGNVNLFFKQLTFFLLLILNNYPYITFISNKIIPLLNVLRTIKQFYEKGLLHPMENSISYEEENKTFHYGKDISFIEDSNNANIEIKDLFWNDDYIDYIKIKKMISQFYLIEDAQIDNIISITTNWKFTFGFVELYYFKKAFIIKNHKQFRDNLVKLEKEIKNIIDENNLYKYNKKNIDGYLIDDKTSKLFNEIKQKLKEKVGYEFELYPFGSITQFLSVSTSDLDIYLKIHTNNIKKKEEVLYKIFTVVREIDVNAKSIITSRICLITFKYQGIKIDLSYIAFAPYLHSNLLRTYALIEPRFSILAICIKKFIRELNIKNSDDNKEFLNSFSWMMLLITFLQEIIFPPVLPKLLTTAKTTKKFVSFGRKDKKIYYNDRTFTYFVLNEKIEPIDVPIDNYENYKDVYMQMISHNGKNKMSISELIIKFFEFVGFYFKYDTVYVNCGFKDEGLQNMSYIFKNKEEDEKFYNYYIKKYFINEFNLDYSKRDGMFLFREPFDANYNPGQTLKCENTELFINKVRDGYKNLVKNGKFNMGDINYDYNEN